MTHTPDILRPDRRLVEALRGIGTATISSELRNLGIRNAAITGPRAFTAGRKSSSTATCSTTPERATWSSSMRGATWTAASSAR